MVNAKTDEEALKWSDDFRLLLYRMKNNKEFKKNKIFKDINAENIEVFKKIPKSAKKENFDAILSCISSYTINDIILKGEDIISRIDERLISNKARVFEGMFDKKMLDYYKIENPPYSAQEGKLISKDGKKMLRGLKFSFEEVQKFPNFKEVITKTSYLRDSEKKNALERFVYLELNKNIPLYKKKVEDKNKLIMNDIKNLESFKFEPFKTNSLDFKELMMEIEDEKFSNSFSNSFYVARMKKVAEFVKEKINVIQKNNDKEGMLKVMESSAAIDICKILTFSRYNDYDRIMKYIKTNCTQENLDRELKLLKK